MKRKMLAALLLVAVIVSLAASALAATPVIKKTEYEGNGYVEVDFKKNVQYRNLKVTVKDASGKSCTAKVIEKDKDDLTFYVKGVEAGAKYAYTISGVRAGKSGAFTSVSGSFKVPAAKLAIKKVKYDRRDKELEIKFKTNVEYKNLKVTVKDASGKSYKVSKTEKDRDEVEVRVKGLTKGEKYTVTVSGVRAEGASGYGSVSKAFTA